MMRCTRRGCKRVFDDHASGAKTDRPGLAEALAYLRAGDTLVVWKLDRLGRSMSHLIEKVGELAARGVGFRSLTEQIDTTTSGGMLVFNIFGSLAHFERDLICERTNAGLKAARERGSLGGRRPVITPDKLRKTRDHIAAGLTVREAATVSRLAKPPSTRRSKGPLLKPQPDVPPSFASSVHKYHFRAVTPIRRRDDQRWRLAPLGRDRTRLGVAKLDRGQIMGRNAGVASALAVANKGGPHHAALFVEQLCVGARAHENDDSVSPGRVVDFIDQQKVAANVTVPVSRPVTLEWMIEPFRAERGIVGDQQQHCFFEAVKSYRPDRDSRSQSFRNDLA